MPSVLLVRIRAASEELAGALRQTNDPAFDASALHVTVGRLQATVAGVERATAEASAAGRAEARSHPAYAEYKDRLAQLQAVLPSWKTLLLVYRARLDRKSERVTTARRWAEAYNRTR